MSAGSKKVRLSLAPMALTSTGELLINAAEFAVLTSFERALRAAKKSGLPVFIGLLLPQRERTEAMKAIDDAAADVAGNVGGRIPEEGLHREEPGSNMSAKLTPAIVEDDDDLAEAVDAFVHADPEDRAHLRVMVFDREALRVCADADVWESFVQLCEEMDARTANLITAVARWAFEQGRRWPDVEGSA